MCSRITASSRCRVSISGHWRHSRHALRQGVAHPHPAYRPRDTEHSVLHAVIREHLEPFLREVSARGDGSSLPRFVEHEFRDFLGCGVLAEGFTRLRCPECAFERLVPFSRKRRGFCPSCGGRRMAEHAASLVDAVLPRVPVRQWVLTLPYRLRYRLAWDHALCRAVLGVYARTLLAFYARTARAHGIQDGQTGTVTVTPRPHRAMRTWRVSSPPSAPGSGSCSPAATWSPPTTRPRRTRSPKS